jgi:glucose/arabinose dehydrogenase
MEIALHPRFEENRLTYLTYSQAGEDMRMAVTRTRPESGPSIM